MKINVSIDNKMINSILDDAIEKIEKVCDEEFKNCCYQIVNDAKRLCPVDTGTLRRSIGVEFDHSGNSWSAIIGTDVEYAYWVENGHATVNGNKVTGWVPAQPFLSPAIEMNKEFIRKYLEEKISKALGGSSL